MAASSTPRDPLDPLLSSYYDLQQRNINDTYQMGMSDLREQQAMGDLSFNQKMNALNQRLNQQQNTLADPYANRGLLNSGIYNYNGAGAGSLGALQQFAVNSATARSNLLGQQNTFDQGIYTKGLGLGTTQGDDLAGVNMERAGSQASQAIKDAIAGA